MQRFLVPVSTAFARNAWHNAPPPPICVQNTTKNLLQIISPAAYLSGTKNSDNRKKNLKNPQILG